MDVKQQIIANYKIIRLIGKGGMASVYEVSDINTGQRFAMKILNIEHAVKPVIRQRFINEASVMKMLNHPNILKVHQLIEQGNEIAMVMELLQGRDLAKFVHENGELSPESVRYITINILKALDFSHSKGIIHRDIKPSNIFITNDKQIKLLDFGIAKILRKGGNITEAKTIMGTAVYMSPEQIKESKNVDNLSDIYSLGVLLYYMLTGKQPYNNNLSDYEIKEKIVKENLPDINNSFYNAIIKKATQKIPTNRFLTCKEFAIAFDKGVVQDEIDTVWLNKIVVGRSNDCDIIVNKPYVSRRHLELSLKTSDNTFYVTDLNSTSGTYVNGNRIYGKYLLKKGDVLKIADITIPWEKYYDKLKHDHQWQPETIYKETANNNFDEQTQDDYIVFEQTDNDVASKLKDKSLFAYYIDALRNIFNFQGRARRKEYWSFVLFFIVNFLAIAFVFRVIGTILEENGAKLDDDHPFILFFVFVILLYLAIHFLTSISVGVRRMHDTNNSGWMLLVPVFPLIIALTEGTIGDNQYGKDTKT